MAVAVGNGPGKGGATLQTATSIPPLPWTITVPICRQASACSLESGCELQVWPLITPFPTCATIKPPHLAVLKLARFQLQPRSTKNLFSMNMSLMRCGSLGALPASQMWRMPSMT
eukprot:CAMPEP_0180544476 /NCGR_PEP_ID=MMETSP1036_2-20121128/69534_1 /TAXON_ID=632150 /ORGANISM="Azadinium spinosum, Strain 3D9" /LENGTH=114 /DNA_ID=CAMNT_0022559469 /DNA_START=209 /DNA_END=549 /DNA_ORIENTATION=-